MVAGWSELRQGTFEVTTDILAARRLIQDALAAASQTSVFLASAQAANAATIAALKQALQSGVEETVNVGGNPRRAPVRTSPPAPHGLPCQDRRRPRTASLHPRPYRPPDFRPACHRRRAKLPARPPRPPQRHPCLVETQPDLTAETAGRSGITCGPPITSGFKPSETTGSNLVRDNKSPAARPLRAMMPRGRNWTNRMMIRIM